MSGAITPASLPAGSSPRENRAAGSTGPGLTGSLATRGRISGSAAIHARVGGGDRTGVLIRLEGAIDDLLHEIKMAGGLPEFEATLRKARRILVRSHGE